MTDQPKVSTEAWEQSLHAHTDAAAGTRMAVTDADVAKADDAYFQECEEDPHQGGLRAALESFAAAHSCEPTDAQRKSYDPLQDEPT